MRTFHGLEKVIPLVRSRDENVKIQTAYAINNFAMDELNHGVLRVSMKFQFSHVLIKIAKLITMNIFGTIHKNITFLCYLTIVMTKSLQIICH